MIINAVSKHRGIVKAIKRCDNELIINGNLGKAGINIKATGRVALTTAICLTLVAVACIIAVAVIFSNGETASHARAFVGSLFQALCASKGQMQHSDFF